LDHIVFQVTIIKIDLVEISSAVVAREFGMDPLRANTKPWMILDHPQTAEEQFKAAGIRTEIGSLKTD